jgi:hydrogenase maturation protease
VIRLIGYGNPARGDDGLGPACARALAELALDGLDVRVDYQLSVDHALWIADARRVVFVDASVQPGAAYRFEAVARLPVGQLASHALRPGDVLALAELLYGATPRAHVMAITGYDFGAVREGLSGRAAAHLADATDFLRGWITMSLREDLEMQTA